MAFVAAKKPCASCEIRLYQFSLHREHVYPLCCVRIEDSQRTPERSVIEKSRVREAHEIICVHLNRAIRYENKQLFNCDENSCIHWRLKKSVCFGAELGQARYRYVALVYRQDLITLGCSWIERDYTQGGTASGNEMHLFHKVDFTRKKLANVSLRNYEPSSCFATSGLAAHLRERGYVFSLNQDSNS